MPLKFEVSVIIPVYNGARFIKRAVASADALSEVREIIIINDGSTDETAAILEELCENNPKLKLVHQHVNMGVSVARNLGLKAASMPFIAFLDADDVYLSNRFIKTAETFANDDQCGWVYESCKIIFENKELEKAFIKGGHTISHQPDKLSGFRTDFFTNLVTQNKAVLLLNGITLRKDLWLSQPVYFDVDLRQTQDTDFIWQLALNNKMIAGQIDEAVAVRYIHGENRVLKDRREASQSYHLFIEKWYRASLANRFSNKVNRYLLKQYAGHAIDPLRPGWQIRLMLLFNMVKEISKHPANWNKWL
ncbi:MAG: glycosyltransferase family A protein [Saprospiraceae bacterium]|nr:glycosyltransferase family A protein [Saprospiraceae bacterium]